jgi:uncharacterized RDD family membrane protein YckC
MENEFDHVMTKQSDKELIKILTVDRHKYHILALESAEAELEERKQLSDDYKKIVKEEEEKIIDEYIVDFDIVGSLIRGINFYIDLFLWLIISVLIEAFVIRLIPEGNDIISLIIYFSTFLLYYGFMEFKYQKTFAKFITKTKVVTLDGHRPNKGKILIRTLSRLIPFDYLSYFISNLGIHDKLSKTCVIKDNPNHLIGHDIKFIFKTIKLQLSLILKV